MRRPQPEWPAAVAALDGEHLQACVQQFLDETAQRQRHATAGAASRSIGAPQPGLSPSLMPPASRR